MSNNQKFWRTIAIILLILFVAHFGRTVVWQIQYYKSIEVLAEHNRLMKLFSSNWTFGDVLEMSYMLRDMYAMMESYLAKELGPEYFQKKKTYWTTCTNEGAAKWVFTSEYGIKEKDIPKSKEKK